MSFWSQYGSQPPRALILDPGSSDTDSGPWRATYRFWALEGATGKTQETIVGIKVAENISEGFLHGCSHFPVQKIKFVVV